MIPTRRNIENLVMRIQSAFLYAPELTLTSPVAEARFGIDSATCLAVLEALVDAGVLAVQDGVYRRYFPGQVDRRAA
jgi:hypothetical protein